jgi:hypothetical protein
MRTQSLRGEVSRRRAEEQFKTTKKINSETKGQHPTASRGRENGAPTRTPANQGRLTRILRNRDAAAATARRSEPRQRVSRTAGFKSVRTQVNRPRTAYAGLTARHRYRSRCTVNSFSIRRLRRQVKSHGAALSGS